MLSERDLRKRLSKQTEMSGRLVLAPLLDEYGSDGGVIQGCAIDLRLGTWFEIPRLHSRGAHDLAADPKSADVPSRPNKSLFVSFRDKFFLHPGSFVLGVTLEWIRMPLDLAGSVTGKSRWGRRGLQPATATLVHPGFVGCLTLELANIGEHPIALTPGMTICQMSVQQLSSEAVEPPQASPLMGHRKPVHIDIVLDSRAEALSNG